MSFDTVPVPFGFGAFGMRGDLLDAQSAVDWAIAQLPVLVKRVVKWKQDHPYAVRIDTNSDPGKKLYRLSDIKSLDPMINAEVGAIVHSIRSSLDVLACTLAARNGMHESKNTYFPIWKTEADFLNSKSQVLEKIKRLSQVDQDIIKNLRPYPGGNDTLCALHDLDLTRKHRRLLNTFVFPRGIGTQGFGDAPITIHEFGFHDEAVMISTDAAVPDGKVNIGLHVAFDESGPTHGVEFVGAISEFARLALSIIRRFN